MPLNPKQQRFVQVYAKTLDAAEAAREAGYSPKNAKSQGWELLQHTEIKQAVQDHLARRRHDDELSEEWVLARLKENVIRCQAAQPILDAHGGETGEFRFDSSGANKALELIGRHLAMFTDKIRVSEFEGMTDDELESRIREKLESRVVAVVEGARNPQQAVEDQKLLPGQRAAAP